MNTPGQRKRLTKRAAWTVFISHSGTDSWVARQIANHVERAGAKAFLDEADIGIAEDFEEEILTALEQSNELLVVLTPWSLQRPYVWAEIGAAWVRRIRIVGVLHGLTPETLTAQPGTPVLLKKRNLLDINDLDRYFIELKKRASRKPRKE